MAKLDIFETFSYDGELYLVSTGTGEMTYPTDLGGPAAFAYYADDVEEWRANADEEDGYQDFCETVDPVTDRGLALALAVEGLRLTRPGSCAPVLTDAEFRRAASGVSGESNDGPGA